MNELITILKIDGDLIQNSLTNSGTNLVWKIENSFAHEWNETHPLTMTAGQVYDCDKFHFLKTGCLSNFRVPVYKGDPLPWLKWNPSFNDDCWQTVRVSKVSLSEKWMLNYTTSGFPFIKGFRSHEWYDTRL